MTCFQQQKISDPDDPEIRNKKNCPMLTRIQHTDLANGILGQAKSTEKKTYPFQARSSLVAARLSAFSNSPLNLAHLNISWNT